MCCGKLQIPTSKTQRSSNLQTPTNHFPRLWRLELGISLVLGAYGRSWLERSDSRNVHLVMRAVARASLCNRNRSMPTAPRNSDIRRNSGLRNSKSPAVVSLRITVFSFTKQSRSDHNTRPILKTQVQKKLPSESTGMPRSGSRRH